MLWYLVIFCKYHQHKTFNKTSFFKNNDTKKITHLVKNDTWKTLWNFIWLSKQTYIRSDMCVLLIANEFNYLHCIYFSFKYLVASWIQQKNLPIHGVIKTPAWLNLIEDVIPMTTKIQWRLNIGQIVCFDIYWADQ